MFVGKDIKDILKFLTGELHATLKDLFVGLERLSFEDNFQSFEATVKIAVGQDLPIPNKLPVAPSKMIIISQTGNAVIKKGAKKWDGSTVSIRSYGPTDVTVTVLFMR